MTTPSTANSGSSPSDSAAQDVPASSGTTRSTVDGERAPRTPNERDESSDSGAGVPSELMRRAHDDVQGGKTPTDKSETTDQTYRDALRGPIPGRERDGDSR